MSSSTDENLFQTDVFRRLVLLNMMQAIVFAVTGMVDCAFVGQNWGTEGLAGMKLAMPAFAVLYLLGTILSSGFSVQVTRHLAKGDRQRANQCLLWVCTAAAGIAFVLILAAILFPEVLTAFFAGQTHQTPVYRQTRGYLLPILIGAFPIIMHYVLSTVVSMEGAGRRMAASVAVVLVTDVVGDLLAVKLKAGICGIAVASVAAYFCACLVLAGQFSGGKTIFRMDRLRRQKGLLAAVLISGLPMAVKGFCDFVCPFAVNRVMLRYGTVSGLAALSIQDAAHYLPLALSEGIAAAVLLLTGLNAAEQDASALGKERRTIRRSGIVFGTAWGIVLAFSAPLLVRLLTRDPSIRGLGLSALLWYLLGTPFTCLNYAATAYLQGLGQQRAAGTAALVNKLLLPVPVMWIMGRFAGTQGIFAAFAVHEMIFTALLVVLQLCRRRKKKKPFGEDTWENAVAEDSRTLSDVCQVTEASEALVRLCEASGIDSKRAAHVGLCLEELGTNSILHGLAERRGHVEYRFVITEKQMILRLRDNGRPFDLTERYRLLNPEDPASHLGLRLVFAAAENVEYSHSFSLNNVCIRIARNGNGTDAEKREES